MFEIRLQVGDACSVLLEKMLVDALVSTALVEVCVEDVWEADPLDSSLSKVLETLLLADAFEADVIFAAVAVPALDPKSGTGVYTGT